MVLFESNYIILRRNTSVKTQNILNTIKISASENVCLLVNESIEANTVDQDLQEQSDLDLHCLSKRLRNISADDKSR